jgi:hypothetical protein
MLDLCCCCTSGAKKNLPRILKWSEKVESQAWVEVINECAGRPVPNNEALSELLMCDPCGGKMLI